MEITLKLATDTPYEFKKSMVSALLGTNIRPHYVFMIADGLYAMTRVPHHKSISVPVFVETWLESIRNDPSNLELKLEFFQKKWVEGFDCDN